MRPSLGLGTKLGAGITSNKTDLSVRLIMETEQGLQEIIKLSTYIAEKSLKKYHELVSLAGYYFFNLHYH